MHRSKSCDGTCCCCFSSAAASSTACAFARPSRITRPARGRSPSSSSTAPPRWRRRTGPQGQDAPRRSQAPRADLVETLGRDSQAMVIAFDETANIMQTFTSDVSDAEAADRRYRADRQEEQAEDWPISSPRPQTNFNPEQLRVDVRTRPEVWLYSDGKVTDAAELSIRGDLKLRARSARIRPPTSPSSR